MARLLSQIAVIIRGSVGGITYSANQFHQIIARARTSPTQPHTTLQTAIRSAMTGAADSWNQLDAAEQLAWDTYADATPFPGPLGPYTVTGRSIFMAAKMLRLYLDDTTVITPGGPDTAPDQLSGFYNLSRVKVATFAVPSETGVAVNASTEELVDAAVLAEISGPFQPARKRYKGPWVPGSSIGQVIPMASAGLINFTGLNEGAVYFVRLKAVSDDAPGRVSPEFILRATAIAVGP